MRRRPISLALLPLFACYMLYTAACRKRTDGTSTTPVNDSIPTIDSPVINHGPDSSLAQRYTHLMAGTRHYKGSFYQWMPSNTISYDLGDTDMTITVLNDSQVLINEKDYYGDTFKFNRYPHAPSFGYDFDTANEIVFYHSIVPPWNAVEIYYYYHRDSIGFFEWSGSMQQRQQTEYHTQ